MLIADLEKNVTHFSEQLRLNAKHKDEVVIGGKITSIVPPLDEEIPMYIFMLDDYVGTIHAFVPETLVNAYPDSFQKDKFIVLEGLVNVVRRSVNKKSKKELSVYCFDLKDVSKI